MTNLSELREKAVLPLVWVDDRAETPFGEYAVNHYDDEGGAGWVFSFDDQDRGNFATMGEAKTAAEADYAQRILSAIDPSLFERMEALEKALEAVRANLVRLAWEENTTIIESIDAALARSTLTGEKK